MANGHDVADTPIDLKGIEELTGVTITFTDRTTEISGAVIGAAGRAGAAYSAVVFPADTTLWSPTSRRIKAIPLATNSTYHILICRLAATVWPSSTIWILRISRRRIF